MASLPKVPLAEEQSPPVTAREGETRRASERLPRTRAERLAAAHEWVLTHHAETFRKLSE